MNFPFFTIVIPTRNRVQTLEYSIPTILNQTFKDFEIVVSDNSSNDETFEFIQNLKNEQVKYYRTNGKLSMVDNWEWVLSFVKGKYVIYIGDDDGLLENALSVAHEILVKKSPDVLFFNWVGYNWPKQIDASVNPNQIQIKHSAQKEGFIDSKQILKSVLNAQSIYYVMPTIYTAFFSLDFIQSCKAKNGRFFNSINPDIYSGVLSCYFSNSLYKINNFLGIRGTSNYSNGAAFSNKSDENKHLTDDFNLLNSLSECKWNDQIPFFISNYVFPVESYFQLCKIYEIAISKKDLLKYYIKIVRRAYFDYRHDKSRVISDFGIIKEVINKNSNLPKAFRFSLNKYIGKLENDKNFNIKPIAKIPSPEYGLNGDSLTINASNYKITNILEAQKFLNGLLN